MNIDEICPGLHKCALSSYKPVSGDGYAWLLAEDKSTSVDTLD